jgi:hypothetical protein
MGQDENITISPIAQDTADRFSELQVRFPKEPGAVQVFLPERAFCDQGEILAPSGDALRPSLWEGWGGGVLGYREEGPLGVAVTAQAVAREDAVAFQLRFSNRTDRTLTNIRAVVRNCVRNISGFPFMDLQHAYYSSELKLCSFAATNRLRASRPGQLPSCALRVRGVTNKIEDATEGTNPSYVRDLSREVADLGMVLLGSQDRKRVLTVVWKPCRFVCVDANNLSFHADPHFPDLAPGEAATAEGMLFFQMGPVPVMFRRAAAWAVGRAT